MSFFEQVCFSSFTGYCERGEKSCPLETHTEMLCLGLEMQSDFHYSGRDFKSHSE